MSWTSSSQRWGLRGKGLQEFYSSQTEGELSNPSTKGQNRQLLLLYALRPGPQLHDLIMPDELRWS